MGRGDRRAAFHHPLADRLWGIERKGTIASQQEEIDRLNARVDNLEAREKVNLELIEELREQNGLLREALGRGNSAAVR